jgi:hypothetical protein
MSINDIKDVIGGSQWYEEDHETIQRYDDEIQIKEITNVS